MDAMQKISMISPSSTETTTLEDHLLHEKAVVALYNQKFTEAEENPRETKTLL